ncbi:hypothetical protein [Piscinibacter koreensis]|uniref:Uncharacterized protein n=1 Tax=Piscinibacter koreensis TaxID=2742824 RepID=A0A7Y6TWG5_9BURK|nr:hypothetical protein [Schlegelella koreensis]NUZ06109.1 hypothetical protein [Schlegelella koreensis]
MPDKETLIRGTPTFASVLDCICASRHDDEVVVAVSYLNDPRGFEVFLARLESLADSATDRRSMRNIALALACSPVSVPYNYRGYEGKSMAQIEADYAYFVALARRAATLKARAEASIGETIDAPADPRW